MSLQQQLNSFKTEFVRTAPAGRAALSDAKFQEVRTNFVLEGAIGLGDRAPDFHLSDPKGRAVLLRDLLQAGPAVVTFYRGGWCRHCNIQLRAYQAILPEISSLGARLVAISPQLPDGSPLTTELTFDVLSDVGNEIARRLGLVWSLPEELHAALRSNGKALPGINGDESWELPVPATYVIGRDGRSAGPRPSSRAADRETRPHGQPHER